MNDHPENLHGEEQDRPEVEEEKIIQVKFENTLMKKEHREEEEKRAGAQALGLMLIASTVFLCLIAWAVFKFVGS